ncbi:MAG: LysR substrate-binding domain-containing protein, partial [Pseudomonadota bacterium]
QIAQLEKDLDVKLFNRSRAQIRLTPAGDVLLERARQVLDMLDSALREVTSIGQGSAGRLRIAFVGSASHGVLPTIIKSYRSHFPEVELALSAMNNAELERALVQREIDIAVARPRLRGAEFRTAELHREPLVLAMPDNSALNAKVTIDLKDLTSETFIFYPRRPRPSFADHVLSVLAEEGVTPKDAIFAQDYQTAISLVSVGVGLSIVPESVSSTQRPGVFYRPYHGFNPGTALSAHARRDDTKPHMLNFFKIIETYTRRPH